MMHRASDDEITVWRARRAEPLGLSQGAPPPGMDAGTAFRARLGCALLALVLLIAAPLMAAPAAAQAATPAAVTAEADKAAIRAVGREWVRAFKAGDIEGLMALYVPEAEVALHGQPKLKGLAAVRAYFTPMLASPPDADFLLAEEGLDLHGDVAIFLSKYWFTLRTPKGVVEDAGRSLLVYRRGDDGRWRIRVDIDQGSPDVAFPPPPEAR